MVVVGLGTLLSALAGSTINLGLPSLGREHGVPLSETRWVVQAFLLTVGVLLLVAGRLGDLLGHRRLYLWGFVLFGLASLGCGLAPGFASLLAMRVLQGVGSAMLMASGPALLTTSVPGSHRGRALGVLSTATYVGLTFGPPVGGALVELGGWRWTFFVNVPVSLVVAAMGFALLPRRPRPEGAMAFDWRGALTLVSGLPLLLLALSEGNVWGWSSPVTLATGLAGCAGLTVFLLTQRRRASPLLDLGLFGSRLFVGAVLSAVANYVALFVLIILLPFYLEEGRGFSMSRAGLLLAVQPAAMALVASPSGWLSDRIGSRALAVGGLGTMGGGMLLCSLLDSSSGDGTIALYLGLVGLGTGIFISPNSSALMGSAPKRLQGTAGGILAEARIIGMLLGVTLGTSVYAAMGGSSGLGWTPTDFKALRVALLAAGAVALVGAFAAALRGNKGPALGT
jgi:EmrB/QacA subfamily drug resistance transporter